MNFVLILTEFVTANTSGSSSNGMTALRFATIDDARDAAIGLTLNVGNAGNQSYHYARLIDIAGRQVWSYYNGAITDSRTW